MIAYLSCILILDLLLVEMLFVLTMMVKYLNNQCGIMVFLIWRGRIYLEMPVGIWMCIMTKYILLKTANLYCFTREIMVLLIIRMFNLILMDIQFMITIGMEQKYRLKQNI